MNHRNLRSPHPGRPVRAALHAVAAACVLALSGPAFADLGIPGVVSIDSQQIGSIGEGSVTSVVAGESGTLASGVELQGPVAGTGVDVSGNTLRAASVSNRAASQLNANGTSPAYAVGNTQIDSTLIRDASAVDVRVGITATPLNSETNIVSGSSLAVRGNTIASEVRANDAGNGIALTASGQLATGASVSNVQVSSGWITAVTDRTGIRVRANDIAVEDSSVAVSGNAISATAVGSSASSGLGLSAARVAAGSVAAVTSLQTQDGSVSAVANGAVRARLEDSAIAGGSAAVTGNSIDAIAQGTSAINAVRIDAADVQGTAGVVSSSQYTSGAVRAMQDTGRAPGAAGLSVTAAYGTPLAVTGNAIRALAGQNEADNRIVAPQGNLSNTSLSVSNTQDGSGESSASARPGLVGISVDLAAGASLAVTVNLVKAQ